MVPRHNRHTKVMSGVASVRYIGHHSPPILVIFISPPQPLSDPLNSRQAPLAPPALTQPQHPSAPLSLPQSSSASLSPDLGSSSRTYLAHLVLFGFSTIKSLCFIWIPDPPHRPMSHCAPFELAQICLYVWLACTAQAQQSVHSKHDCAIF